MTKEIPIIIPAFGQYDLLNKCINSIIDNTTIPFRIIVVDDCFMLPYDNNAVEIIRNEKNLGFTKSINVGLRYLHGNYDYVVILNSDTEVTKNWLESCIPIAMMDSKIGIIGGLGKNPSDEKNHQDCEMADLIGGHSIIELVNEEKKKYSETMHDMICFSFFFAFFTKSLIETIGIFDERYITWCSDSDYALTSLSRGFRNVYNPNCIIKHKTSSTVKQLPPGSLKKDQMQFIKKWCGGMANELFKKIPFNCENDIIAQVGVGFYDKDNKPVDFKDIFPGVKQDVKKAG